MVVTTGYPWDGRVALRVVRAPRDETDLRLRVPAWCTHAVLRHGGAVVGEHAGGTAGYASLRRRFAPGDVVEFDLAMDVRRLEADPRAEALRGMVAFARGPIVYCAEQTDCAAPVERLVAAPSLQLVPERRDDLLGGVTVLRGELLDGGDRTWTGRALYRPVPDAARTAVTLVPYAVWDNREPGPMAVWLPTAPRLPRTGGPELTAAIGISFENWNCDPEGLRDGEEPKRSGDTPARNCHWWNHLGGTEWVQYSWPEPQRISGSRIFWFDDSGHGACRLPQSARLLVRDGEQWRELDAEVPIERDRWCEVRFRAVTTTAVRLQVRQRDGFASGVLEWRLLDDER